MPLITAVLGVLILGEVLFAFEQMWRDRQSDQPPFEVSQSRDNKLTWKDRRKLMPFISVSAVIGTGIGALPGIGSTLAATLGYATGERMHKGKVPFGQGTPEGVAATEAANSSVSGANLIPVLSLGIPGNVGAVFLILAAESIGGFNLGLRFPVHNLGGEPGTGHCLWPLHHDDAGQHHELDHRWSIQRTVGVMASIPKQVLLPIVLLLTMTAIYVQETDFNAFLPLLLQFSAT